MEDSVVLGSSVMFGAIGFYIATIAYIRTPSRLRKKLRSNFWTVTKYKSTIDLDGNKYCSLTLADYHSVPSRYKGVRAILAIYNIVVSPCFWLLSVEVVSSCGAKLWLWYNEKDIAAATYIDHSKALFGAFAVIIIALLILCGLYAVFDEISDQTRKVDASGDYIRGE